MCGRPVAASTSAPSATRPPPIEQRTTRCSRAWARPCSPGASSALPTSIRSRREQPTAAFLLRGSAGLAGLAALGAVLFGATYAWLTPVGWLALTLFVPHRPGGVTGWLLAPAGSGAAAWTGAVLLATGTACYALFGPRATARVTC
ncbi:hypothetical protein AB0R12_30960 [Streptomyces niveus]|uniref:hypothetical protein n=1 Tax=Streptomyces niveus TaxID=193462 RepID=UPI00343D6A07